MPAKYFTLWITASYFKVTPHSTKTLHNSKHPVTSMSVGRYSVLQVFWYLTIEMIQSYFSDIWQLKRFSRTKIASISRSRATRVNSFLESSGREIAQLRLQEIGFRFELRHGSNKPWICNIFSASNCVSNRLGSDSKEPQLCHILAAIKLNSGTVFPSLR